MTTWAEVAAEAIGHYGALQHPTELAVLLAILEGADPERIIEIGTWSGGLTWALSQLSEVRTVVTVDRKPQPGFDLVLKSLSRVIVPVQGDSTDPYTRDKVTVGLGGQLADVLVIDGGHDYHTAVRDWQIYTPLLHDDGLAVIHDTQGYPGVVPFDVPKVWDKIRRLHRTLELVAQPGGPGGTGIAWLGHPADPGR